MTMDLTSGSPDEPTLKSLAAKICDRHRRAQSLAESAIRYAKEAGEALLEAKGQLPHGSFLPWLADNFPDISTRQLNRYMQVTRDWDEIEKRIEKDGPLSITQAVNTGVDKSDAHVGFEIPLPKKGQRLVAFLREDGDDDDFLEIVPTDDSDYFFLARFNFIDLNNEFCQRAIHGDHVAFFLEGIAPDFDLKTLSWISDSHPPLKGSHHPLSRSVRWWLRYRHADYWFAPPEVMPVVTVETVWDEALNQADSDQRLSPYSPSEIALIRKYAEEEFSQLEHSANSDNRPKGRCPECGHMDGQFWGFGLCWQHRLCWRIDKGRGTPGQIEETDRHRDQARMVLLEGFFCKATVAEPAGALKAGDAPW
jgi:hypothetical protein